MKKQYFDAVRSGCKTTTLRYWRRPMVRPGSVQLVRGLGHVRIDEVRRTSADQLTAADVRADGFADLAALRKALGEHYPAAARRGRSLYRVRFTLIASDETA